MPRPNKKKNEHKKREKKTAQDLLAREFHYLLIGVVRQNVVIVPVTQFDVGTLELGRQRLKRARCAHGRKGGPVQRFFPGVALDYWFVGRHAAVAIDPEGEIDDASLPKFD